jgi:hypothetical protein
VPAVPAVAAGTFPFPSSADGRLTDEAGRPTACRWSKTARATASGNQGSARSSSSGAARRAFSVPYWRSNRVRRPGPSPVMPSRALLVIPLPRSWRW